MTVTSTDTPHQEATKMMSTTEQQVQRILHIIDKAGGD